MTALSSTIEWVWFVHDDNQTYPQEIYDARDFITSIMIPTLESKEIPVTFVYDPVVNTINVVFPRMVLVGDPTIRDVFKDAQFYEKAIPEKDWQSSADLREAILHGSNFNTKWH